MWIRKRPVPLGISASPIRSGSVLGAGLPILALLLVCAACIAVSLAWIRATPRVGGWDEVGYMTLAFSDQVLRVQEGWGALRDSLFMHYRWQPPGPRLLALPLSLTGLMTQTSLRLFALALWLFTILATFDAARRVAGTAAAAAATALIAVGPAMVLAAENYMSETLLLPCVAGLLWCLVRESEENQPGLWNPVLLGLCIGGGMLSRLSILPLLSGALFALALATLIAPDRRERLWRLLLAFAIAALIAWPHYAVNLARYLGYARFAVTWPLDLLASSGTLDFFWRWLQRVSADVFGPLAIWAVALGLVLAGVAMVKRGRRLFARPGPAVTAFVATTIMFGLTLAGHLAGYNQNPRYLVGALPALAILLALGLALWRWSIAVGAGLAVAQAAVMGVLALHPAERDGQLSGLSALSDRPNTVCDWDPLLALAARLGHPAPVIQGFGASDGFNHVQMEAAFFARGLRPNIAPFRLEAAKDPERPEDLDAAAAADLVLVLDPATDPFPHRLAVPSPNRFNAAALARLSSDPRFASLGVLDPAAAAPCRLYAFATRAQDSGL